MLNELQKLVNELQATNSNNGKMSILKRYPQCKQLLMYTYNPFFQFNVTSKNLKKKAKKLKDIEVEQKPNDIIELLDLLRNRSITGNAAIATVNSFADDNKEYEDLIHNIIDKNLKTRADAKLINKVFPGLVPSFDVALAQKYDDHESKIDFGKDEWLASRKLDGVRCVIRKEGDSVTCWSRQGKQFETLKVLEDSIRNLRIANAVFDGEACKVDEDGNEDFQGIMKEIRKKDHTIKNPKYFIFDILTLEEFDSKTSKRILSERLSEYQDLFVMNQRLRLLQQLKVENKDHLKTLQKRAVDLGWEGLILRKDVEYEGKRTKNLLKVKKMADAEYKVEGIETGPLRIIDNERPDELKIGLYDQRGDFWGHYDSLSEAGVAAKEINKDNIEEFGEPLTFEFSQEYVRPEKTIQVMTRVNIRHKGNIVGVGSGFSLEQRIHYYENPDEIIGKIITVQYFEETKNQRGEFSLRFPVFKGIHGEKRDT